MSDGMACPTCGFDPGWACDCDGFWTRRDMELAARKHPAAVDDVLQREGDKVYIESMPDVKPWLPRCPLCGQEYCGCWEDDA